MDSDLAALRYNLNSGVRQTLLALADWHEEHGEMTTAIGYRWLALHNKYPVANLTMYRWGMIGNDPQHDRTNRLPVGAISKLVSHACNATGYHPVELDNVADAFAVAALAVGEWILDTKK